MYYIILLPDLNELVSSIIKINIIYKTSIHKAACITQLMPCIILLISKKNVLILHVQLFIYLRSC